MNSEIIEAMQQANRRILDRSAVSHTFSLIIPTFNRPDLLRKLMCYLSMKAAGFAIHVLDSSGEDAKNVNRDLCARSDLNVTYCDYPQDMQPTHKMLDALRRIETDYVSICADDDIIFPDSIPECVEYLASHPDYIACHGDYIMFEQVRQNAVSISLEYGLPSIDGESASERILQLMTKYESMFFAVFRTSVILGAFEKIVDISSNMFQELFLSLAPLAIGKSNRGKFVYYSRSAGPMAEPDRAKWYPAYWFADNPEEQFTEYVKYRNLLLEYVSQHDRNVQNDASGRKLMDFIHGVYLIDFFTKAYLLDLINCQFGLQVPRWIKNLIAFPAIGITGKLVKYIADPSRVFLRLRQMIAYIGERRFQTKTYTIRSQNGRVSTYSVAPSVLRQVNHDELVKSLQEMNRYFGSPV